jgi:tRNA/tmRNA/rRNA uracil-C5-methylase (TrmA/RlmC/RlmD family)
MDQKTLEIEKTVYGGAGLARMDGKVVFVMGALPGETAVCRITSDKTNYCEAEIIGITKSSPRRIAEKCRFCRKPGVKDNEFCPGCAWQHTDYAHEIELKSSQLSDFIGHSAGMKITAAPPAPSEKELEYRGKITMHGGLAGGKKRLGYVSADNKGVVDIDNCPLAVPQINTLLAELRARDGFAGSVEPHSAITLRFTEKDGALWWRGKKPDSKKPLTEKTSLGELLIPRGGFFQVNSSGCGVLVSEVQRIVTGLGPELVIDLYCGSGIFSLAAAKSGAAKVLGADSDAASTGAAAQNAAAMGLKNCSFTAGEAEKLGPVIFRDKVKDPAKTLLIVDPPRTGVHKDVLKAVVARRIKNVLYISCAPDTLTRDIKRLSDAGWGAEYVRLVDMFPRTAHFETVCLLSLGK